MDFRIADTFTDSLAKLTGNEQKAAKTSAFDLQLNPARPGLRFHKLDGARDPNFWSVRVSRDIRIIVHRTRSSLMLCYVGHHDGAYKWAERRKLETHPRTGAAQLIEVRQRVQEITVPMYSAAEQIVPARSPLLAEISESDLLGYGVPAEWVNDVRAADEDSLLELADHLPGEAAEALLELAVGGTPKPMLPVYASGPPEQWALGVRDGEPGDPTRPIVGSDAFEHPDAARRFRTVKDAAELERVLDYPRDKWAVFLHPAQRQVVEGDYSGQFRVCGAAGTGKTVVAMHRAVFLARAHPDARVLLTTFSNTLAGFLRSQLRRLIRNEPRLAERVETVAIDSVGEKLFQARIGSPNIATRELVRELLRDAARQTQSPHRFSLRFLLGEWENVVDAWQVDSWDAYRTVKRLGRKTRLPLEQRTVLWAIFERVKADLRDRNLVTKADMFSVLAEKLETRGNPPFDFAVVDEAQDIGVAQLRFLAALGGGRPNSLFFVGDQGQRIFRTPFSWKALGVDVRGRSHALKLSYRTSHQIRIQTDRLLGPELADVDGNVEDRRGTVSAFNGEHPAMRVFESESEERQAVAAWLRERREEGVAPDEIGVFVRSPSQLDRARSAVRDAEMGFNVLDENGRKRDDAVVIGTMPLAKGLEYRAVAVMACDDDVIPLQERIENIAEDSDLEEVYDTERHLLYVACTRARDHLMVTGVAPASEFLDDLHGSKGALGGSSRPPTLRD